MRTLAVFVTILSLFSSLPGHSAERSFRVAQSKRITTLVDRLYAKDGNAFGTVFCHAEAPQVLFVDSRYQDLDGKTFFFKSLEACDQGRINARELSQKCAVELILDEGTQAAEVRVRQCSGN
ncbi:MAG: hypothetical protein OM95_09295 [Bdellovibrio sp. ArHS]|uniref:hypothetical protein n=1 Tax=Bdellovibrio sp. ArHS TaxID=1569284 RepID=UPI0005829C1C|nr:hypothetical protein [Bdellovibrio sp. ArHS]KHD88329.1 MAG: hypothetical protein OM95_09295 [Bdellovibrio sp. ArHS]